MTGYIDKDIDELSEDFTTPVVSTTSEHMSRINKSGKCLNQERYILFHKLVLKVLFASNNARLYIYTTVEFLTTRVPESDEDDRKTL